MKNQKVYLLLCLLFLGLQVSAQTSKSKSSKHKSKAKSQTAVKKAEAVPPTEEVVSASAPVEVPPAPPMPPPPNMMKYFVNAYPEFTVLVKAINATELNATFESDGPITVFAPVDKTFDNLRAGTIKNILQPEMRDSLKGVLTYMVISGSWSLAQLEEKIKEGGGSASIPTVGGSGKLTFVLDGSAVRVKDNRGTQMQLSNPIRTSSGLVYMVDKLLLP